MVDKLKMLSPRSLAKRGSLNADNAGHKARPVSYTHLTLPTTPYV